MRNRAGEAVFGRGVGAGQPGRPRHHLPRDRAFNSGLRRFDIGMPVEHPLHDLVNALCRCARRGQRQQQRRGNRSAEW